MNDELRDFIARQAWDEAQASLQQLPPTSAPWRDAHRVLAQALVSAGQAARALPLLDEVDRLCPKQAWVSLQRAMLAGRGGDANASLRHLQQAFELEPADAELASAYISALVHADLQDAAARVQAEHRNHAMYAHESLALWQAPARPALADESADRRGVRLYLDLLEKTVSNWIYGDARNLMGRMVPYDDETRVVGRDIPSQAHTMIGLRRLRQLRVVAEQAIAERVPGDFVETGVWRGGACILLAGVLHAHAVHDRKVVVADSFEGLPAPDPRYPKDDLSAFDFHLRPELAVGLEQVQANFARYELLDDRVAFLKGFFRDTLPAYPHGPIAILRMDGDMYSSTMDALVHLYPLVSPGGWVICDDYGVVIDARRAVLDFRARHRIGAAMFAIDGDAVAWRKL